MFENNFIDARQFTFRPFPHPFHPESTGDSGALEFAVSKKDPEEQYIVKRGNEYPELAANEFMYHKVADALGLYTQDVFLISGNRDYRRSAAIRYVPNAKLFRLSESSEDNYKAYFGFQALYAILSESDSNEYYLDAQSRLFKVDNACAFLVDPLLIMILDGNPVENLFHRNLRATLTSTDYTEIATWYKTILQDNDSSAVDAFLSVCRRFCEFDETVFDVAYTDLKKHYPAMLAHYYDNFIRNRKDRCRKFLDEIGRGE